MARRNHVVRSWLTTSLLMFSGTAGLVLPPASAGAAVPAGTIYVRVHPTAFEVENPVDPSKPNVVWARPKQKIVFRLVDPMDRNHSVTVDPAKCQGKPSQLCDKTFEDETSVEYLWYTEGEYDFYDRFSPATGRFIISSADPTVPPPTTTTTLAPTTTTTRPATTTTTAPTTATTAPTSVRPFLVPDPAPTTTTTVAANQPTPPTTAAPATKDKPKDKGKDKTASPSTPTTAAPAPPDTMPPDFIFDPAALTPSPTLTPDAPPTDSGDEAALNASAAANLLEPQKSDDKNLLLMMALGALTLMLLVGATWAWFTRSSQYDPA